MSQLKTFTDKVRQDAALRARLTAGIPGEDTLVERIIAEAEALGHDLDTEEVRALVQAAGEERELSDADLQQVAGADAWAGEGNCIRHSFDFRD